MGARIYSKFSRPQGSGAPVTDEDDPLSLDFTKAFTPAGKSAPPASSAPPVEPVEPAAAVSAAPAAPAAAKATEAPLPPALLEAAELHAAGKDLEASRRLEAAIKANEPMGETADRAWRALFELLQEQGNAAAFDKLALAYARRFELSPPTWNAPAEPDHQAEASSGGRAHVALTGTLDARVGESLKQMLKLAQTAPLVRIDLGKLTGVDNDGATLLMRALGALKQARREYVFGSPGGLISMLAGRLEPGRREQQSAWLLMLELYQQIYDQTAFEEAAVNYAVTFEVSPPSFEAPRPGRPLPVAVTAPPVRNAGDFALGGQMIGAGAGAFAELERVAAGRTEVDIDALGLRRIDAASTEHLKTAIGRIAAAGCHVRLLGLSELVAAWLRARGFGDIATLSTRKA